MRPQQASFWARPLAIVALCTCLLAAGALSAQQGNLNPNFQAERKRLQIWAAENRKEQHLEVTAALLRINPFAGGAPAMPKVTPGGSVVVTIPGEYPAGTVVISERDSVSLSATKMTAKGYSTRLTVAADEFPGFAQLLAMTPISFDINQSFLAVAFIDAVYRIDLMSPTGIKVTVTPLERSFAMDPAGKNARLRYRAEFYRPGETKPFQTLIGIQDFSSDEHASAHFDVSFNHAADSPQEQLENLNRKMVDPKTTEAERNALMVRIAQLSQQLMDDATKAFNDPATASRTVDDFGCGLVQLYRGASAGTVEGMFSCGKNFYDGILKVAGTMTLVK